MVALRMVWAVVSRQAWATAPFLAEIVGMLWDCEELNLDDQIAAQLCSTSAVTISRRGAGE